MGVLLAATASLLLVASAAAKAPTPAQLPDIVLPDAALARVADGLPQRLAFSSTAEDAARSTLDPFDTGADLRRLGRVAGYVRARSARGRASRGLLVVATSAILFRDASAAAASIQRDVADGKRFSGKKVEEGELVSFTATKMPSLGIGAVLVHIRMRPIGGTDGFGTQVAFRVGQLRGNAIVSHTGSRNADALALDLAKQLRRRMLAALRRR